MNPYAAELRRKAMCRLATLRSARARAARVILQERTNPQIEALGATLRHGVPAAGTSEPEHEGPNVSTQPTLFVDVAKSPPPAMPQAFGQRTLSGVGAFDRAPDDAFTPDYAPALPDRPFLAWLKEAAAQQEAEALRPEHAQPIRVPTVAAESSEKLVLDIPDMQAIARPLPLAARVQPVAEPEPDYSYLTWVGCFCAIGLVCLTLWPFEVNAVTQGSFQRYSQIELAVSPLQAPVVAVHVVPGQRVQAGAPLISFDASAFEHELAELNTALDTALVAQVAAQAAQQAVLDAQAQKQVEAQSGIEQRAAKKPAELAMLEANVLPVEPSALDDRMDERRRKPQAIQDQHEQLSAGSEVEQLAHTITSLRERRVALQRKLHSRQVVAAHGGIVTQVVPALGDMVDSGAPVVRIVPDNPVLRLIALFDIREANDLRVAKHAILTLGADEMVVGAQVVRVHGHEVELKLDDAASVPEVDRQLQRDAHLSAEFERERSLLALAVERLRARHRH